MPLNAAGLDVSGSGNPRWKGGPVRKKCVQCGVEFAAKYNNRGARFCSLQCVGESQRGVGKRHKEPIVKKCLECASEFSVRPSLGPRRYFCQPICQRSYRSRANAGAGNPNWVGGISRLPYPFNFSAVSKRIIARDGRQCMNPECRGSDCRLTTHHIDYDKANCSDKNLICLCSSCNSRANYGRAQWQQFYESLMASRGIA